MKKRTKLTDEQKEKALESALKIVANKGYTADDGDAVRNALGLDVSYWIQIEKAAMRVLIEAILKRNAFR